MKFLTKAILKKIPALYSQEKLGDDAIAYVKFFTPDSSWTWYVTELNPDTNIAFGLVFGHEVELGYFSLDEIQELRGPFDLPVERDLWFKPQTLASVRTLH